MVSRDPCGLLLVVGKVPAGCNGSVWSEARIVTASSLLVDKFFVELCR